MKKDLKAKVEKDMPEFVSEVWSLGTEEINSRLAELAKAEDAMDDARDQDDKLEEARAVAKELAAPYREAKSMIKMKSKYLVLMLKDRGAA